MSNPTAQGKEQGNTMEKHILVALPLSEAQRDIIRQAAPQFAYRFTTEETATREEILWADAILGNVPVALIRQNKHLEWFQSNFAGPDPYLEPGVLPENCLVTNATGAYGLAISEWMLGMWLALAKDLQLYRDRQRQHHWEAIQRPVRSLFGARVLCVGMGVPGLLDIEAGVSRFSPNFPQWEDVPVAAWLGERLLGPARRVVESHALAISRAGSEIVTAQLEGNILPGITRKSVLQLAQDKGIATEERRISVAELFKAYEQGRLTEAFGTGTAAVISPIGEMGWEDKHVVVNGGKIGPLAQKLYDTLTGIQWGTRPDPFGWVVKL